MQLFQHNATIDKGHVYTTQNTVNEDKNTNYIDYIDSSIHIHYPNTLEIMETLDIHTHYLFTLHE